MDTDAYYTYIHETLDRGNLEEILNLYKLNSLSREGLIVLTLIDKVTPVLSRKHRYPKFRKFRDLIAYHQDVTSPLHKMHINNGFILLPENMRIPFEKKEFFRLMRRTPSINGVRIIFGAAYRYGSLVLDSFSEKPDLAFALSRVTEASGSSVGDIVKIDKDFELTTYGSQYYKDLDEARPVRISLLKMSDGQKRRLSYTEILEDDRIDGWFNSDSPLTNKMICNDIEIFTNFEEKISNADFLLEICDGKKQGLVFNGVDENGEYISFNYSEKMKVVPFYYVSFVDNLRISFPDYINRDRLERMQLHGDERIDLPVIPKDIPHDARKSILLYYLQDMVFPKDFHENFGLTTDEVRRYSEKGICYDVPEEKILYLTVDEELKKGKVIIFLDEREYRVLEKVFSENGVNTYSILAI